MKAFINFISGLTILCISFLNQSYSQVSEDWICGVSGIESSGIHDTLIGGRYKPARSDFNTSDPTSYFPILIVFVQFKNEIGDSTTTEFTAWPARRPPNYLDSIIRGDKNSITNWWDAYNGYDVSDFWHEYSRGKLHVIGQAISIILPHDSAWYANFGEGDSVHAKINKDIYDTLKQIIGVNWPFYDKWKYNAHGNFSYERDERVDMMYLVFRTRFNSRIFAPSYYGFASLGSCFGSDTTFNDYTVYQSGGTVVKINGTKDRFEESTYGIGSGLILYGGGNSPNSRYIYFDYASHEYCHYLFGLKHANYGRLVATAGIVAGMEFGLSPWEAVKLGFIKQKIANYPNPTNYLYDYSSHGGMGGDSGEVIQVSIVDTTEFFLLANRRKISKWDKRMAGDSLANDRFQYFKNINEEYGKGLYIYHVKGGYQFLDPNYTYDENDVDMECADGLWKWDSTSTSRRRVNIDIDEKVIVKSYPMYSNDYPDGNPSGYTSGRDEMSKSIIFTPGTPDDFYTTPIERGTHSLFTNIENYWYSLASLGDRWDAWNVGYNEVFSPYSSPSTRAMNNNNTGIFIWYGAFDNSNNKATIEIYRAGYGNKTEEQILRLTPPSRPMGLRILSCDSLPLIDGFKRMKLRWNHNMEPDMGTLEQGSEHYSKKYKIYRSTAQLNTDVPPDAMFYPEQYYEHIETVFIDENSIPEFTDTTISYCVVPVPVSCPPFCWTAYPVRYRVQAVDKYDSSSRLSDFAKTIAGIPDAGGMSDDNLAIQQNNIPKEYSLKQNYPNPFNPTTNIQYELPFNNFVTIKIYDVLGKEIKTLVNEFKNAGSYITSFNGSKLSSGFIFTE